MRRNITSLPSFSLYLPGQEPLYAQKADCVLLPYFHFSRLKDSSKAAEFEEQEDSEPALPSSGPAALQRGCCHSGVCEYFSRGVLPDGLVLTDKPMTEYFTR